VPVKLLFIAYVITKKVEGKTGKLLWYSSLNVLCSVFGKVFLLVRIWDLMWDWHCGIVDAGDGVFGRGREIDAGCKSNDGKQPFLKIGILKLQSGTEFRTNYCPVFNTVIIWKPDGPVFWWSFFGHNLCPVFKCIWNKIADHSKTRQICPVFKWSEFFAKLGHFYTKNSYIYLMV
jgi:hypothetical protein